MYASSTSSYAFSQSLQRPASGHITVVSKNRSINVQRSYTPNSNVVRQASDVALALLIAMAERAHTFLLGFAQNAADRIET